MRGVDTRDGPPCLYNSCTPLDCEYHYVDATPTTCTPKENVCVSGHSNYQKGEKLQLRYIDKTENVTGTCDASLTRQTDCNLPSNFCESDRCVYQETWTPVGECKPLPIAVCDPSDPATYRKGIQMKTRQLKENCDYCGPCPIQDTTNDECTVPD